MQFLSFYLPQNLVLNPLNANGMDFLHLTTDSKAVYFEIAFPERELSAVRRGGQLWQSGISVEYVAVKK